MRSAAELPLLGPVATMGDLVATGRLAAAAVAADKSFLMQPRVVKQVVHRRSITANLGFRLAAAATGAAAVARGFLAVAVAVAVADRVVVTAEKMAKTESREAVGAAVAAVITRMGIRWEDKAEAAGS